MTVSASLDNIEPVFARFRCCCRCLLKGQEPFVAELLLREALTNAVVHGSGNDPEKSVRCVIRMKANRLLICVSDDGDGFNWYRQERLEADNDACSGRGLTIFRMYATRVRFNPKGNTVILAKTFV